MAKNGHNHRIISADSHVNPPPMIYRERLPSDLKDRAPRVEMRDDKQVLIFDGQEQGFANLSGAAGTAPKEVSMVAKTWEAGRRGGWEPAPRIEDMALDGVDAEVLYGSGDGGGITLKTIDRPLRYGLMHAYNDWLIEYCAGAPDKLVGIADIPIWDIGLAIKEATWAHENGLRGALIPAIPAFHDSPEEDKPYTDPHYEPLWATLAELEMPVNMHLGPKPITRGLDKHMMISVSLNKAMMGEPIASFIFSGVLERHPKLQIVSVESGVGWMAFLVEWMDHVFGRHRYHQKSTLGENPSVFFKRQVSGTFIEDRVGVQCRNVIGVQSIMWSSDYPHINSSWPKSQEAIEYHFAGVAEDERALMVGGNCARIYDL